MLMCLRLNFILNAIHSRCLFKIIYIKSERVFDGICLQKMCFVIKDKVIQSSLGRKLLNCTYILFMSTPFHFLYLTPTPPTLSLPFSAGSSFEISKTDLNTG